MKEFFIFFYLDIGIIYYMSRYIVYYILCIIIRGLYSYILTSNIEYRISNIEYRISNIKMKFENENDTNIYIYIQQKSP